MIWVSVHEHTVPLIVSVDVDFAQPRRHPATAGHIKIFIFMPPLNSRRQGIASFSPRLVRWGMTCLFYGVLAELGAGAAVSIFVALIT